MFLANENFPKPSTLKLRKNGITFKSIQEDCPGISDREVLQIAKELDLIILTFDSDYGELIFRYSIENPPSVVYFRNKKNSPDLAADVLIALLLKQKIVLQNSFTVIEEDNIRQRFYQ